MMKNKGLFEIALHMCKQIMDFPYFELSRLHLPENYGVAFFGDGFRVPTKSSLAMLTLYYDDIIIPHPLDLLAPLSNFYRKRGFQRQAERLVKKYLEIIEWVERGAVKMVKIDRKSAEVLHKSVENDLSDKNYVKYLNQVSEKLGELFFLPELTRDIRSRWVGEGDDPAEAFGSFIGQSYLYNTNWALLVASICGATPITDLLFPEECLKYKMDRFASLNPKMKVPEVLSMVLSITVPYAKTLNLDEIIELKRKRKGPLSRFRERLRNLSLEITYSPWDYDFQQEVAQVVQKEIIPELKGVRRQLREIQPNLREAGLRALVSQIPYIGAITDLYDVIQTWRRKRDLEKNSLYFLALL